MHQVFGYPVLILAILFFNFLRLVWVGISNTWESVLSGHPAPRITTKILCYASFFLNSSLIVRYPEWRNTLSLIRLIYFLNHLIRLCTVIGLETPKHAILQTPQDIPNEGTLTHNPYSVHLQNTYNGILNWPSICLPLPRVPSLS